MGGEFFGISGLPFFCMFDGTEQGHSEQGRAKTSRGGLGGAGPEPSRAELWAKISWATLGRAGLKQAEPSPDKPSLGTLFEILYFASSGSAVSFVPKGSEGHEKKGAVDYI